MPRTLALATLLSITGLLAGSAAAQNVSAQLKGTTLVVTGGDGSEVLTVANEAGLVDGDGGSSGTTVVLVPGLDTTLNETSDAISFDGVTKLRFSLNGGSDELSFAQFSFTGPLVVHGGDGADQISFSTSDIVGPVKLLGDAGDDSFDFTDATFTGSLKILGSTGVLDVEAVDASCENLQIKGGPSVDVVSFGAFSADSVKINLSAGDDQVLVDSISVGLGFAALLGPGVNSLNVTGENAIGENLLYRGGTGDDTVLVQDTSVGENLDVKLFGGANSFTLASVAASMNVGEHLVVSGGAQTDDITVSDANGVAFPALGIGSGAKLALKGGVNVVGITGFAQINGLSITLGPQDDSVSLDGCQIQSKMSVALSNGTNDLTLNDTELQADLLVTAGAGDDTVALTGTTAVAGQQKIHLGGGTNTQP